MSIPDRELVLPHLVHRAAGEAHAFPRSPSRRPTYPEDVFAPLNPHLLDLAGPTAIRTWATPFSTTSYASSTTTARWRSSSTTAPSCCSPPTARRCADSRGLLPPGRHRRVTRLGVTVPPVERFSSPSAEASAGCFQNRREVRPESVALAWAPRRPFSGSPECRFWR